MPREGRRYRIDKDGNEVPIWASKATIQRMARADAARDVREGYEFAGSGNMTFDEAYRRERARLEEEARRR